MLCTTFGFLYLLEVQAFLVNPQVQQAQGDPEERNQINMFQCNNFSFANVIIFLFCI